ncbi:sensor domain-containing phosphodiesterase [Consotaella salsifontis]|uniref:EAL domain, c-di-GMP-specific phosphodiesterase class I (Or its enzymatically inactive variant) n=1 Tax=Consotaella salsifontis TaxID=1365950 RepID=A0A1T4P2H3_9HYPH|nr:EAL domain-containing protein [Consotaella salsifontis]SJZ85725.1 EAL domain, c-di-GMP-specific phosphodiesterase class I (or its enzymatically inactive variant) [Consotaella salsifontis]
MPQLAIKEPHTPDELVGTLRAIREHLGMEVAYVSEFVGERSVLRAVDAPGFEAVAQTGASFSLDDVYCRHILAGRLPELMADTGEYELARQMPITSALPIGAHISVPVNGPDGTALGMFCCLSTRPDHSLNERDVEVMRVFAEMAGKPLAEAIAERQLRDYARSRIENILAGDGLTIVYQPIWTLSGRTVRGFEALSRFAAEPYRSPDKWFAEAFDIGMGVDLEIEAIRRALTALNHLPAAIYVSVNASPETVLSGRLPELFSARRYCPQRILLEITEHAEVEDYEAFAKALAPLRKAGVRLAIDDAGAGYSGLQHIVKLAPDKIKLDMSLTSGIDTDAARRALASALVFFARETGCAIVAEGVETEEELMTLRLLGVSYGQGFGLGRPMALPQALELVRAPLRVSPGARA